MTNRKTVSAPEGFVIIKSNDQEHHLTTYEFHFDRKYSHRLATDDLAISEEWIEKLIVEDGMEHLIEDMERCIAKYKESKNPNAHHIGPLTLDSKAK